MFLTRAVYVIYIVLDLLTTASCSCSQYVNETTCTMHVQCINNIDINMEYLRRHNTEWTNCQHVAILSPYDNYQYCLPISLTYTKEFYDSKEFEPSFDENMQVERNLIKFLYLRLYVSNTFPSLSHMKILEYVNASHNFITAVKLSSSNYLPALKTLDVSYNIIKEVFVGSQENPFTNLQNLNISHNKITELDDSVFNSFVDLKELDLSFNEISVINAFTFEGVRNLLYLNLADNKIKNINSSLFRFTKLHYLMLQHNEIYKISAGDISPLRELREVDLSYNVISSIESSAFSDMTFLRKLNLRKNLIINLDANMFSNTSSLQFIDLSLNEIHRLSKFVFRGRNVSYFDISKNGLEGALLKGMFEGLSFVVELDISYQKITSIGDFAFVGLDTLETLLLNNNKIQNVTKKSYRSLLRLKRLDLSYNEIHTLDFDLTELIKLEALFLRGNLINCIGKGHFEGLSLMRILDIANNNISKVESHSFAGLKQIVEFDISKNPLSGALEDGTFEGLNAIPILDISYSHLTIINNNTFSMMNSLKTLNISHGTLNELSFNCFLNTGDVHILDLSYNSLKAFNINATTLAHLRSLYLQHNLIDHISSEFFSNSLMIHTINLSSNKINILQEETLSGCNDLEILDLSNNKDLILNSTLIVKFKKLQKLYISGIKHALVFNGESQITELDMSKSKIHNITFHRFKFLKQLQYLSMNNNNIEKLEVGALENLTDLETLDLSFNELAFIQPGAFKDNTYLSNLNMSHNRLTSLNYGVFKGLVSLIKLDLSYNEIDDLKSERFYGVQSLHTLIVDYNKIKKVESEDISRELSVLSIGSNLILCDNIIELKRMVVITAMQLDDANENIDGVSCYGPDKSNHLSHSFNGTEDTLSDIRDILLDLSSDIKRNASRSAINSFDNELIKSSVQDVLKTTNVTNTFLKAIKDEQNVSNSLQERILKMIVALTNIKQTTPLPILFNNDTKNVLPLLTKIKEDFENTLTIEKEKILSEVSDKIAQVSKKIEDSNIKSVTEKYSREPKMGSNLLFIEVCVALLLLIALCFTMFKVYKHVIILPRQRSYSTQQIAQAMENSSL